jgi:hypothetical protein
MSMLKVIEVLAESNKSWEDAVHNAVAQANKTCGTFVRFISKTWKPLSRTEKSSLTASMAKYPSCLSDVYSAWLRLGGAEVPKAESAFGRR